MTGPTVVVGATVDRVEGQRLAREELTDPVYQSSEPSLFGLIFGRVLRWFGDAMDSLAGAVGGGWWTLVAVLVLLLALAVLLVVRVSPSRRSRRDATVVDSGPIRTPADHRAEAERRAAAGDHAAAVRYRMRAISRDLEQRAIIVSRPGRTATELAGEAAASLPDLRAELVAAADLFNEVAYGGRTATAAGYHTVRDLDLRIQASRPRHAATERSGATR